MRVLVVVLVSFAAVLAQPSSKTSLRQTLEWARDTESFKRVLGDYNADKLREDAAALSKDMEEAVKDIEELVVLGGIFYHDFKLKEKAEEIKQKLVSKFLDVELDLEKLTGIPEDPKEWIILNRCLKEAKKTDFNSYPEPVDFMNAVFKAVLNCAGSGLAVMDKLADIGDMDKSEITLEELGSRLSKLERIAHELAHLVKFTVDFIDRVKDKGFNGDKNDIVWDDDHDGATHDDDDDDDDDNGPTTSGPSHDDDDDDDDDDGPTTSGPSHDDDDDDDEDDDDDHGPTTSGPLHDDVDGPTSEMPNEDENERLLLRVLSILRKQKATKDGLKMGPKPTGMGPKPTGMGPKPTGMGPKPTGMGPKTTGMGPKPTGMGPKPTGMGPKPRGMGPKPTGMGPKPTGMGPKPTGMGPKTTGMGPKPRRMGPKPTGMGPKTTGMGPKPTGMGPKPTGMGPKPTGKGPKPTGMGPKPTGMENKPTGKGPVRDDDRNKDFIQSLLQEADRRSLSN